MAELKDRAHAIARDLFEVDARALATLRICVGLLLLLDLLDRAGNLDWYAEAAFYPLALANATSGPVLSLHLLSDSVWVQGGLFALASLAALALTLGWRTRAATVASWALLISLHHRNWIFQDVGDGVLVQALFWCMFLPLGKRWSLDARRDGAQRGPICSVASAGLLLLPAWVFFFAGLSKLKSVPWRTGDALGTVLSDDLWLRPLGELLLASPQLTGTLTRGTIAVEVLAPLCLFVPLATRFVRPLALASLAAFVVGIGSCIQLGWIPWVMAATLIPFLPPPVWDRLEPDPDGDDPEGSGEGSSEEGEPVPADRLRRTGDVVCALALGFAFVGNVDAVVGRVHLLPRPAALAAYAARLEQGWDMYTPPPVGRFRLTVHLLLEDGSERELAVGAERAGWPDTEAWPPLEALWNDYRAKMYLHENVAFPFMEAELDAFLAWVCAAWDAEHPELRARSATLFKVVRGPPGSEGANGLRPVESEAKALANYTSRRKA
jgi:uncharacterized membrane protein YphA (DoxX/SURF4 family)